MGDAHDRPSHAVQIEDAFRFCNSWPAEVPRVATAAAINRATGASIVRIGYELSADLASTLFAELGELALLDQVEWYVQRTPDAVWEKQFGGALRLFKIVDLKSQIIEGPRGERFYRPVFQLREPDEVATAIAPPQSPEVSYVRRINTVRMLLRPMIEKFPKRPPRTKAEIFREIVGQVPGITQNAFDTAWKQEADSHLGCGWLKVRGRTAKRNP